MRIQIINSFQNLPLDATLLLNESEKTSFFLGPTWVMNFSDNQVVGANASRFYLIYAEADKLVAMFCMHDKSESSTVMAGARELGSMSNYYTSLFSPVFQNNEKLLHETLDYFTAYLKQEASTWDVVDIKPLDFEQALFDQLKSSFLKSGYYVQQYFCFGNWFMNTKGMSFEEYFSSLSSRVRNTVNRKEKKLNKQYEVKIRIVTACEDLESLIDDYEKIYRLSWKKNEPSEDFIQNIIRDYSKNGYLRLGVIYVDGEPAAAQIWFVCHNVASIYKLSYDENFSKLSVGSILTKALMRHVLDIDKVHEIDYLTGDDSYKKDWMTSRRERWGIMAFNKGTIRGNLLALRHIFPVICKKYFKRNSKPES